MEKQPLETLKKKSGNKIFVYLRSWRTNSIVAMGNFPENCPQDAIARWIRTKNQEYLMVT